MSQILEQRTNSNKVSYLNFKIDGRHPLSGNIITNTSKNSPVALICASLLNNQKTILRDVPGVADVFSVIKILKSIGVKINWVGKSDVEIVVPDILKLDGIDKEEVLKTRSILLLIGAVLARTDKFKIPHAGGCKLGARTIRPHLFALEELGVKVKSAHDYYEVDASGKNQLNLFFTSQVIPLPKMPSWPQAA